jgi:hypothetical protein
MRTRSTALAALLIASLAGCGPTTSSQSPTPTVTPTVAPTTAVGPSASAADPATVYAAIRAQVEAIRGLEPTNDIAPVLIDETQLKNNLQADFDRQNPAAAIEIGQRTLIALGFLPKGSSLRAAVLALQSGQVAGYYSPTEKQLFVVSRSGAIGPTQRSTYAHEFTHELQDQHFDLKSLGLQTSDQGDRSLARLAMVEGDAVSVQYSWMQQHFGPDDLAQLLKDAQDPAALAALNNAPPYLRDTALFPYSAGLAFVQGLLQTGGYAAVNAAFAKPPDSTEQIIHPDKYKSGEKPIGVVVPTDLASRMGAGWTATGQDTLGELLFRLWLSEAGIAPTVASDAAAGWGGDRLVLLEGPVGDAVAVESVWDTAADADAFASVAITAMSARALAGMVVHVAGSTRVSLAIGASSTTLAGLLPG